MYVFKFLGDMLSNSLLLYCCEDKSCKGISLILKHNRKYHCSFANGFFLGVILLQVLKQHSQH